MTKNHHAAEFRRCLIDLDVKAMRRLWRHVSPHLAQPADDAGTLATLHAARTAARSIPDKLRFYSHRWLTERDLPSQLPDELKPSAERMFPRVVSAVGVAVVSAHPQVVTEVRGAMSDAVAEAYADKRTEPAFVRDRMFEARARALKGLGLR